MCLLSKRWRHFLDSFVFSSKVTWKRKENDPILLGSHGIWTFVPPEYSRYLHSHLDIPVVEYNVDQDLPGNFKNHWAKNLPFLIEDYEEQPGLQPHIK